MRGAVFVSALALTGCMQTGGTGGVATVEPVYAGIETRLLDGDLVNFLVVMPQVRSAADVEDYAECAAAQYALIRGYGFARHLRTTVKEEGGLWRGDAVYTISAALPPGLRTIDAEVTALACAENGIPMV
ncbi:hypothetical protein [Cognatishimia sp. F0-27]|uniref:hypothetical protein n=1 Tax=Cognatishimia sp. F0-27 TaxID=2816855 RepID=UPI001D0C3375|nr:hypothetical protein [Cognatishimia sp. F0-27]MCC1492312.1 hypothetical protein [Cognatishimia sp. F0-27]